MIQNSDYVPLHCHGHTSFLDGRARHEEIVDHAVRLGNQAVSLTDHDEVNGHISMWNLCQKAGIKFIPGAEQRWLFENTAASKAAKTSGLDASHIILLAGDNEGLKNLWTLSSLAYEPENFYGKPQLNPALMKEYSAGLWASDGCFAGEERYLTVGGAKAFGETVGTTQMVLGAEGNWTEGEIRSFGTQEVYRLRVARYGVEREVLTTANHRWLTAGYRFPSGSLRKDPARDQKLTVDLSPGDVLRTAFSRKYTSRVVMTPAAIQAGIVFGDGTTDSRGTRRSARVKLYSEKSELLKWFPLNPTTACATEDAIEVRGLPGGYKEAPSLTESTLSYLYWWLAGYFAADGSVSPHGTAKISSSRIADIRLVADVCQLLGIRTGSITEEARSKTTPQGVLHEDHRMFFVSLNGRDVQGEDFFLRAKHRDRVATMRQKTEKAWSDWTVVSVDATGSREEVFCAVVPEGSAFTLEGNILTGNCGLTRFAEYVEADLYDSARREWAVLMDIFGEKFYSELHTFQFFKPDGRELTDNEKNINAKITKMNQAKVRFSQEMGVPLVVVNDSHYVPESDWKQHRLVWKMNVRNKKDQSEGDAHAADWMMDVDELTHCMGLHGTPVSVIEEAIKNTSWIADQCNAEIKPTISMPRLHGSRTEDDRAFQEACEEGLKRFILDRGLDEEVYRPRLEREMSLIVDKDMCFPAGTQVTMGDGSLAPIEEVVSGDMVLTRRGSEPVGEVVVRSVDEDLVVLRGAGSFRALCGTANHPVLTPTGWRNLGDVVVGDEVAVDLVPERPVASLDLVDEAINQGWDVLDAGGSFVRGGTGKGRAARRHTGSMPVRVDATPELMYLIGLWVAEGHLISPSASNSPGQVGWTLHRDEEEIATRLQSCLDALGAGVLRVYSKTSPCSPAHRGVTYMVTNHPLALLLESLVGCGVRSKKLSEWIMGQPWGMLQHLVQGWVDGDGTVVAKKRQTVVYTMNDTLAYQLRQIMLRSGVWATETLDNRGCRLVKWVSGRTKAPYGARRDGDRWWVRVKSLSPQSYRGVVYNLSVDGDPTYVANGVRVHNCGYFNVVADYVGRARDGSYIRWVKPVAKDTPCVCGPGRGSGGGSLVNYVLGITSLDPIKYDLTFERFINPDRPDYPDIDVDFQRSHRKDLISYMGKRYGEDKVVAIGTKSRSGPAKTLQDLCVAMGIPFTKSVAMSKLIRQVDFTDDHDFDEDPDYTPPLWSEVIETIGGDLAPYVSEFPELFERVEQMVGLCRQPGVHAAGIVVSTEAILGAVPTRRKGGKEESPVTTQFDMNEVAWLGGVKDDFLSNKGLDVLSMAREMIYERSGVWIDYDGFGFGIPEGADVITLGDEEYADPVIWEQIDKGYTAGIFQINTPSGTKQAMRFRPRSLQDLADLVSINRPGVLRVKGLLQLYLDRRHGVEPIQFDHPLMEPITGRTMGILVYQEDLIRTARDLAGFSAGDAERLRKGIGKKLAHVLAELKPQFLDGCMANPEFTGQGGTRFVAEKIWGSLEAAGAYAFNRAHATGYAMQAVWEIWTKHYCFQEFITACLAVYDDKTNIFIRECRRRKQPILPPDVNKSGARFTLCDGEIRYGMADINGIGEAGDSIPEILRERPFVDFQDYLDRTTKGAGRKKGVADNLVKIGAFDFTGQGRQEMLNQLYRHRRSEQAPKLWAKMTPAERGDDIILQRKKKPNDYLVFDFDSPTSVMVIEEELVGTFITQDPMADYASMIEAECIGHPGEMEGYETGETFTIGGKLSKLRKHMQKNGQEMAFLGIRWADEDFEFLAFADSWKQHKWKFQLGYPMACEVIKLSGGGAQLSSAIRLDMLDDDDS